MNAAIRTERLIKRFFQTAALGRTEALSGLDMEVPAGSIYAMVGPNGAGKTTAIKILMNIFGATSGNAEVLGMASTQIAGMAFRRIGYVSENQELPEWMTVGAFLSYLRPFYLTWDTQLEAELVRQFELPRDRKLKALSRGMRMKAALAGALAFRPKLIVLDEPFGGLDPLVRDQLIEGMLDRAADVSAGTTVFLSSHDLAEIESFASHVGYMEQGRLLWSEEMASLTRRFREVEVALDAPAGLPAHLPPSWMQPRTSGAVVQFVDSRFDEQRTAEEIRSTLPTVRDIRIEPMNLRSIFVAMAKTGKQQS